MTNVKRLLAEASPLPWGMPASYRLMSEADYRLIVHAVNHLPDYEAAVDALERLEDIVSLLKVAKFPGVARRLEEARAALSLLRGDAHTG